ncbi:phospho-N-acetylmuramoyl-pentapeptide-transferase [Iocasia frigidifontis]|uniref:Phospho-N-acetylmuramoyl-pentapeptide-transferase n=1 Tax=Iocasia fonsfrigidae TaxID=2682810 RepID=A0A8A7KEZ1_9FIRM|nr:phospho-N-acetylmuramoyl-pentapeptide-transferase [Iocasia fonsfrigidae]QTL98039.1 phospho-N-acetylmuramoyl-pentapeptide-transferase [Iocasia fonsfrigidae]
MRYYLAVIFPFFILLLLGPTLIRVLEFLNYGQQIRDEGPKSHLKKKGIPTMGGILIILAILITALLILDLSSYIIWALIITIGMGLLGFLDDIIKIRSRRSLGLKAREKLIGQVLFALLLAVYVYLYTDLGTFVILPIKGGYINLGYWFFPFVIFTVVGTANGVNLTDGLDGLASGVTLIVVSSLAVLISALGYGQLTLFALIVAGACLGFIWYNSYPAQVFMGDVGSLALGGAVASLAVLSQTELFLLIIGGIYVVETLSVMIQVSYFRCTGGARLFKMSPLHHHYELAGLAESKVVARFWILALIFALMGLASFYVI